MVGCPPLMHFNVRSGLLAALVLGLAAAPAQAEIVYLTTGRTLSVKGHRVDGETIVLTLRGGGDVNIDKTLVDKIIADEVPYPEPEPLAPAAPEAEQPQRTIPYAELISSMSEAHGVDPNLVRALIQVESGYRPTARREDPLLYNSGGERPIMPTVTRACAEAPGYGR